MLLDHCGLPDPYSVGKFYTLPDPKNTLTFRGAQDRSTLGPTNLLASPAHKSSFPSPTVNSSTSNGVLLPVDLN